MKLSKREVLHIGYPKTATTWLQLEVFPKIREMLNDGSFQLISSEDFSGDLFRDNYSKPKEFKQQFSNPKIVVTLRNQISMMPSIYWLYVKSGGELSFVSYVKQLVHNAKFDYHKLLSAYRQYFTADDLLILLYEDLVEDRARFVRTIASFCCSDSKTFNYELLEKEVMRTSACNRGPSVFEIEMQRLANKLTRIFSLPQGNKLSRVLRRLSAIFGNIFSKKRSKRFYLNKRMIKFLHEAYAGTNAKLMREYGLNVAGKGYPTQL